MCLGKDHKHKMVKSKSMYGGGLKEVEFIGTPETMKGKKKMKKKTVPVGMYANKKDILKY